MAASKESACGLSGQIDELRRASESAREALAAADAALARQREAKQEEEPTTNGPEAETGEEGVIDETADLEHAPVAFDEGKQAGLTSAGIWSNPYAEGTASHASWSRGHVQGLKERNATPADGDAEKEEESPIERRRNRRRANKAEETPAAVH